MQKLLLASIFCSLSVAAYTHEHSEPTFPHPFYFGGVGGWGSTTWQGLVPQAQNLNTAIVISTPIAVEEGGGVWGLSLGYEFTPCFALEANYMQFPNAKVIFDEDSLFAFDQNVTTLNTNTETVSLSAKLMVVIPKTTIRLFSSAGIASVFRQDQLSDQYRISPTFGFGINILITDRILAEIGTNYTAGYGESEINPVVDFIPFLYSVFAKAALRFG